MINQSTPEISQQRVTCLELAHIFRLWLRTSKLLSAILYRLKLQAMVFSNQWRVVEQDDCCFSCFSFRLNKSKFGIKVKVTVQGNVYTVQEKKMLSLLDYHVAHYPQHSYEKNVHLPVRLNKSIFLRY